MEELCSRNGKYELFYSLTGTVYRRPSYAALYAALKRRGCEARDDFWTLGDILPTPTAGSTERASRLQNSQVVGK